MIIVIITDGTIGLLGIRGTDGILTMHTIGGTLGIILFTPTTLLTIPAITPDTILGIIRDIILGITRVFMVENMAHMEDM